MSAFLIDFKRKYTAEDVQAFMAFAAPIYSHATKHGGGTRITIHTTRAPTAQELIDAQALLNSLAAPSITEIT